MRSFILVVLACCLVACGQSKPEVGPAPNLGPFAQSLSIYGVKLGMTRDEVEAKIGKPDASGAYKASGKPITVNFDAERVLLLEGDQLEFNGETIFAPPDVAEQVALDKLSTQGARRTDLQGGGADFLKDGCKLSLTGGRARLMVL